MAFREWVFMKKQSKIQSFAEFQVKFLLQLSHFYYFFIILGLNIAAKEYFRLYLVIYKLGEFIF